MATYDKNLFLDCQFHNNDINWILYAQPLTNDDNIKEGGAFSVEVVRGIIQEPEFGVSGSHTWDNLGNTAVGQLVKGGIDKMNSLGSNAAAIIGGLGSLGFNMNVGGLADKSAEMLGNAGKALGSYVGVGNSEKIGENIGKTLGSGLGELMRGSQFVSAFDHIKVFKGTNLEINFPTLETRIYYKQWDRQTVVQVMNRMIKRFVGGTGLWSDSAAVVDKVVGVQRPPNGYIPKFSSMSKGEKIDGTFVLKYGRYVVPNLLVSSFNYRESTFRVRKRNGFSKLTGNPDEIVVSEDEPLYVDIQLTVQPATYVSRDMLMEILKITDSDTMNSMYNGSSEFL